MILINRLKEELEVCLGIYRLFEFSPHNSKHVIELLEGKIIEATFISDKVKQEQSRYAGTIVIFRNTNSGTYFMMPSFEFYDGRHTVK